VSQIKLDPAYKRQLPAPRVGGLKPPEKPQPPRRPSLKLALSALACLVVGAGLVSYWPFVSSWLSR
jgi:hypothetical protein